MTSFYTDEQPYRPTKKLQVTQACLSSDCSLLADDSPHSVGANANRLAVRPSQSWRWIQSFRPAHLPCCHFLFHLNSSAEPAAEGAAKINRCPQNRRSGGNELWYSWADFERERFHRHRKSCGQRED